MARIGEEIGYRRAKKEAIAHTHTNTPSRERERAANRSEPHRASSGSVCVNSRAARVASADINGRPQPELSYISFTTQLVSQCFEPEILSRSDPIRTDPPP